MFGTIKKSAVAYVALLYLLAEVSAEEVQNIGSFYQCAHDLRGVVWVKNDREILITGFDYDGTGPAAWFHGQLRPASSINTGDTRYVTLPFPDDNCDRLERGRSYNNENVTLILPRSINDFETIGIFCYQYCNNFGHIIIPNDLSVPPAPADLISVMECPHPTYRGCSNPRNSELQPDCAGGAVGMGSKVDVGTTATPKAETGTGKRRKAGKERRTFIREWVIFLKSLVF